MSRVHAELPFAAMGHLLLSSLCYLCTDAWTFLHGFFFIGHKYICTPLIETRWRARTPLDTVICTHIHTARAPSTSPLVFTVYPRSHGEHFKDTGLCNLPAISAACVLAPHLLKLNKVEANERRPWPSLQIHRWTVIRTNLLLFKRCLGCCEGWRFGLTFHL